MRDIDRLAESLGSAMANLTADLETTLSPAFSLDDATAWLESNAEEICQMYDVDVIAFLARMNPAERAAWLDRVCSAARATWIELEAAWSAGQ